LRRLTTPGVDGGQQMARKLYAMMRKHQKQGTASRTFGCLDSVQLVQMAPHVECIYVSGWQCAPLPAQSLRSRSSAGQSCFHGSCCPFR
jgi:isocitrate lyase